MNVWEAVYMLMGLWTEFFSNMLMKEESVGVKRIEHRLKFKGSEKYNTMGQIAKVLEGYHINKQNLWIIDHKTLCVHNAMSKKKYVYTI